MATRPYRSAVLENNKDQAIQGIEDKHPDFELVSKFLENANEDILMEIFLRLSNWQRVTLFGTVCRRWRYVVSHREFIRRFKDLRQERYSQSYTILFLMVDWMCRKTSYSRPICKLFSEESMLLHGKEALSSSSSSSSSISYLDFMPLSIVIRASFDDLLLLSTDHRLPRFLDYYICNPVTRKYIQLPKGPNSGGQVAGFALCKNPNEPDATYQYKVVLIHVMYLGITGTPAAIAPEVSFAISMFCSKSGQWSQTRYSLPRPINNDSDDVIKVIDRNGILYWMDTRLHLYRIISFDPFNTSDLCGIIGFPNDFGCVLYTSYLKVHLGVVAGELRLLKLFTNDLGSLVLKVWELRHHQDFPSVSWVLIHEGNLTSPDTGEMASLAFHPKNGNVVFMIWGKCVFKYQILENMYEKVDQLQDPIIVWEQRVMPVTLQHSAWPTPIASHSTGMFDWV